MIEIVSNREGGEDTNKLATYAEIGIRYYVIYDPDGMFGAEALRVYRLEGMSFHRLDEPIWFPEVGLGLALGKVATRTWTTRGCTGSMPTARRCPRDAKGKQAERRARRPSGSAPSDSRRELRQLGVEPG